MATDTLLHIVIPFSKDAALVRSLFDSLEAIVPELNAVGCHVIAINDAPDDRELGSALSKAVTRLSEAVPSEIVQNDRDVGGIRCVDGALSRVASAKHDVLLLHADTIIFPGAVSELRRVAYLDPMIGFVSPRSNNGRVCSLPHRQEVRGISPAEAHANFCKLSRYLPEYHFVPTAEDFCLYIKVEVLEQFGFLRENYAGGRTEEHVVWASRTGYRTVLANHAFVYHEGQCSCRISELHKTQDEKEKDSDKHYYVRGVTDYVGSVHYEAENMLSALLPDRTYRLDVLFDFSGLEPSTSGAFELGRRILKCAIERWQDRFNIFIMVSGDAAQFQHLEVLRTVSFVSPDTRRRFAIAFRVGQVVEYEQLFRISRTGVLNVFGLFDAMALDCSQGNGVDLPVLWSGILQHADGVLYLNDFTRDHCRRRFRVGPNVKEMVAHAAFDLRDAEDGATFAHDSTQDSSPDDRYILIIAPAVDSEFVLATAEALSEAFPTERLMVVADSPDRCNMLANTGGHLDPAGLHGLIRRAKFIICLSVCNDAGIAVLKSLASSKPVLAPSFPAFRRIHENIQDDNFILYSSARDLIDRLQRGFPVWNASGSAKAEKKAVSLEEATLQIGSFLRELLDDWSVSNNLLSRLEHIRLLKDKAMVVSCRATAVDAEARASRAASQLLEVARDRDARIVDILGSLSWRITAPLRTVGGAFLRLFDRARELPDKAVRGSGKKETAMPSIQDFDELAYLTLNPDVEAAVLNGDVQSGYHHWVLYGGAEGRALTSSKFPPAWSEGRYLRVNPDVAASVRAGAFASGYEHWLSSGQYEARSGGGSTLYHRTSLADALKHAPAGFNGVGFYDAGIGLGAAARNFSSALLQVLPFNEISVPWDFERMRELAPKLPKYAVNLIQINPDALPLFLRHSGGSVLPGRYNIAFWIWELHAGYPSWRHLSTIFNEIWTASAFSAAAIRTVAAPPVWVIPHVVDQLPEPASDDRSQFGWKGGVFVFLYIFDLASAFDRKNPLALLRAFQKAFGKRPDVLLVLKFQNPHLDLPGAALLERVAATAPNIQLICETFPEQRVYALLRGCDCFVSPHRSEGFGLNIACAMYYGKPVIATGYSGNLEFTTPENSYLIDYELTAVSREIGYYKPNYAWAEVSEDHLAALLEEVLQSPEESRRKGENGRHTIRERFSVESVTKAIRQRVDQWGC
jgi:glycosyltransferase involved in cell wall biosynthesis